MPHATQILKRERDESPEPSTSKRRRHDADTTPSIPAAEVSYLFVFLPT